MNQVADETPPADAGSRWRKLLFWVLLPCWLGFLYGFVSLPIWMALAMAGPLLFRWGLSLAGQALPHVKDGVAYFVVFLVGLCLLAGSLATLAPGLPGSWLTGTGPGLSLLDKRNRRVELAVREGSGNLAGWLAGRGLGTDTPIDNFGRPLLFDATGPALLEPLLDAGLSPDAVDGDGRTMLMLTHDEDMVAMLLAAGADTEIRDREGRTALFHAAHKEQGVVRSLVEAGANVHATDHADYTVADVFPAEGPLREWLESAAGGASLPAPRNLVAADRGRTDWLLSSVESRQSAVTVNPDKLNPGDIARVDIRIVNDQPVDRLLQVRAVLNDAAYLVDASHEGGAENPRLARISRDLRWPLLTLPANSEGALWVDAVVWGDAGIRDLGVDVFYRNVGASEDEAIGAYLTVVPPQYESGSGFWIPLVATLLIGVAVIYGVQRWLTAKGDGIGSAGYRGAMLGAVICGIILVSLVVGMVEPWVAMEASECEVLDRRVRLETMRTDSTSSRGISRSRYSVYGVPTLAVRYAVAGDQWISTGFNAGMATRNVSELRDFQIGDNVACWYDPDQPARFTVIRSPGAAGITGLIMLLLCTAVFGGIAFAIRRSKS